MDTVRYFSDAEVRAIRRMTANGVSIDWLADEYARQRKTIEDVVGRRSYRHVEAAESDDAPPPSSRLAVKCSWERMVEVLDQVLV